MKKLIEEVSETGYEKLFGEVMTVFCCRYIYTGKLIGVSETCIVLENPSIVYETGPFDSKEWKDAQPLPHKEWSIERGAIESFGIMK